MNFESRKKTNVCKKRKMISQENFLLAYGSIYPESSIRKRLGKYAMGSQQYRSRFGNVDDKPSLNYKHEVTLHCRETTDIQFLASHPIHPIVIVKLKNFTEDVTKSCVYAIYVNTIENVVPFKRFHVVKLANSTWLNCVSLEFSADGKYINIIHNFGSGYSLQRWNTESNKPEEWQFLGPTNAIEKHSVILPDGCNYIEVVPPSTSLPVEKLNLYSIDTNTLQNSVILYNLSKDQNGKSIQNVYVSPDSKNIVITSGSKQYVVSLTELLSKDINVVRRKQKLLENESEVLYKKHDFIVEKQKNELIVKRNEKIIAKTDINTNEKIVIEGNEQMIAFVDNITGVLKTCTISSDSFRSHVLSTNTHHIQTFIHPSLQFMVGIGSDTDGKKQLRFAFQSSTEEDTGIFDHPENFPQLSTLKTMMGKFRMIPPNGTDELALPMVTDKGKVFMIINDMDANPLQPLYITPKDLLDLSDPRTLMDKMRNIKRSDSETTTTKYLINCVDNNKNEFLH